MLRTSTLVTGLLLFGLLHSLQVVAPGWAIDGELIESRAERSVRLCVCARAPVCVTTVDRRNVGDETCYSGLLFLSQSVRAT